MIKLYITLCLLLFPLAFVQTQQAVVTDQDVEVPCADLQVYDIVEEEATPVGGLPAFYKFLADNYVYPKEALKMGIGGISYVRFVISEQGDVICAEIIEGREIGYGLDEEAIRVVKMTKWHPAKQEGKAINQRKILPFSLKPSKPVPLMNRKGD